MHASRNTIQAVRFLRSLRGGGQSALIQADDGFDYILKWHNNLQGKQVTSNEVIGTELYTKLGLSVPEWRGVWVSDQFIDNNCDLWFETESGRVRPTPGLQFASRRVGQAESSVFEVLPGAWYSRVKNRDEFWGALAIDVWAEHIDARQALFLQEPGTELLSAIFIDHGHMFGGPNGAQTVRVRPCLHPNLQAYLADSLTDRLQPWIDRIEKLETADAQQIYNALPAEWRSNEAKRTISVLFERACNVRQMVVAGVLRLIMAGVANHSWSRL